jgi:hypothetical protein
VAISLDGHFTIHYMWQVFPLDPTDSALCHEPVDSGLF